MPADTSIEVKGPFGFSIKGVGHAAFRPVLMIVCVIAASGAVYGAISVGTMRAELKEIHRHLEAQDAKWNDHERRILRLEAKAGLSSADEDKDLSNSTYAKFK